MTDLPENLAQADRLATEIMQENGYRREYLAKAAKCAVRVADLKVKFDALMEQESAP